MGSEHIAVEVAYALPDRQKIIALSVPRGCTAQEAVRLSAMDRYFPDAVLADAKLGIFGKTLSKPDEYVLNVNDRVEIYRPLIIDIKAERRLRAEKAKKKKAKNE